MEPECSAPKVIKLQENVIVFSHEQLMFDQEDFVLDRRNLNFNLYVIICSAEIHDIILACISLDESVKVTKFVTVSGQRL
jgi:hypothetical protein